MDPAQLLPADEGMPAGETTPLLVNDSDDTVLVPLGADSVRPEIGSAYWIEVSAGTVVRCIEQDLSEATEYVPGDTP